MLNVMSKAEFARHLGVNRSTVTRMGQQGRLVLAPNGKVKVAESIAQINATQGARNDVAQRHAIERGHEIALHTNATSAATDKRSEASQWLSEDEEEEMSLDPQTIDKNRADVKAEKMHYENELFDLNDAIEAGTVLEKDSFSMEIADLGKAISDGLDRIVDNLSPQLIAKPSKSNRYAMISKSLKELREEL